MSADAVSDHITELVSQVVVPVCSMHGMFALGKK